MFIKESVYRLITILFVAIFAIGLILSILFIKNIVSLATSPSASAQKAGVAKFDMKTFGEVTKKIGN